MSITKNNILNKVLICGASLVMLASTGAGITSNVVNAKSHHVHIHHVYHHHKHHISNHDYHHANYNKINHRRRHIKYHHIRNNHQSHYLAYNQLIPTVNSIYEQLFRTGGNVNDAKLDNMMALVDNTITHNANNYNHKQIHKLLNNQYNFSLSNSAVNALNNSLKNNHKAQSIINQPQININLKHHHKIHKQQVTSPMIQNSNQIHSSQPANFLPSHKDTLSFDQLIPATKAIYRQIYSGAGINNSHVIQEFNLVNNSIIQNAGNYNQSQLAKLYNNYYYMYFNKRAEHAIAKNLGNYTQAEASQAWNNRGNNDFAKQLAQYEAQDINKAREQHGLKPLPINNYDQVISNMRAKQYTYDMENHDTNTYEQEAANGDNAPADDLAHGVDYHDDFSNDATKVGIRHDNGYSENASTINQSDGYDYGDKFGDKTHWENDDTPKEVAYNDVNDMLNYDRFTGNGHRYNILDSSTTGMGVSSYYHSNGVTGQATNYSPSNGGTIEDFSYGHNPADV